MDDISVLLNQIRNAMGKDLNHAKLLISQARGIAISLLDSVQLDLLHARILVTEGKSEDARKIFEQIELKSHNITDITLNADILLASGQNLMDLGNHEVGIQKANEALQIYQDSENWAKITSAYIIFGNLYYSTTHYDLALENYQKALETAPIKDSAEYARALASVGNIHYVRGELEQAAGFMQRARLLAQQREDFRMYTLVTLNLSLNNFLRGNFTHALHLADQGLASAQKLKNNFLISLLKNLQAMIWMDLGNLQKAELLLEDVHFLIENLSHPHIKLEYTLGKVKLLLLQNRMEQAYTLMKDILSYAQEVKRKVNTIELLCLFAEVAYALGHSEEAYLSITLANELALNDQSDVDRARILTSRGKINLLSHSLEEAKLQIREALWLTQKTHAFELEYQSRLVMIQILIEELHDSNNPSKIHEIQEKIHESLTMAANFALVPCEIQSYTLLGLLYMFQNKFDAARDCWQKGLSLAQKVQLSKSVMRISDYLALLSYSGEQTPSVSASAPLLSTSIIKDRIFNNSSSVQSYAYSLFRDQIAEVTRTITQKQIDPQDLQQILMLSFKLDGKMGPTFQHCSDPARLQNDWTTRLQNISSIYYLTIGQGSAYHQGLFGPFPFLDLESRALVYASFLADDSLTDPRLQNENYIFLVLVFPRKLTPIFYDHYKISTHFQKLIQTLPELNALSQIELANFKQNLLKDLIPSSYAEIQ